MHLCPYAFYNKRLQTLFEDQLGRSKATCSCNNCFMIIFFIADAINPPTISTSHSVNKTSYLDTTCYSSSPLIDPAVDNDFFIGAYMGSRDASADIFFGRKSGTGHPDTPGLPLGAHQVNHPSGDTSASLWYLPQNGGNTRIGAFYCQADLDDVVTQITTIVLHKNGMKHLSQPPLIHHHF